MVISLIIGLIVGFLRSIPIGPTDVCVINVGLNRGPGRALWVGLGSSAMNFVYFVVLYSGISLLPLGETAVPWLKAVGVLFLLGIGISFLKAAPSPDYQQQATLSGDGRWNCFLLGIFLFVSNPTLVATLSALAAVIRSLAVIPEGGGYCVLLSAGFSLGSACWYLLLVKLVEEFRGKITQKILTHVNRACGLLVILFAVYLGITA